MEAGAHLAFSFLCIHPGTPAMGCSAHLSYANVDMSRGSSPRSFRLAVNIAHHRLPSADGPCCSSRGRRSPILRSSQGAVWSADKGLSSAPWWAGQLRYQLCCGYFSRNWWSFISRIPSKIVSSRWTPPCSSRTRSLRGEPLASHQVGA